MGMFICLYTIIFRELHFIIDLNWTYLQEMCKSQLCTFWVIHIFDYIFFSISLKTFLWLNNFLVDKMCCCYIHTKHTSSCCGQILANGWLQNEQTLNCTNWFCTKYCIHSFTFFSLCWIEFIKLFLPLYLLFYFMLWMIFRQLYYSLNTNNNSQQLHTTSITLNKSALSVVIIFNKGTLF